MKVKVYQPSMGYESYWLLLLLLLLMICLLTIQLMNSKQEIHFENTRLLLSSCIVSGQCFCPWLYLWFGVKRVGTAVTDTGCNVHLLLHHLLKPPLAFLPALRPPSARSVS